MAHLITNHDPYHIHKLLGLLVLLHYLYRFSTLWQTGTTAFPSSEPPSVAICGVLLHGMLSWSSLLLPLPTRRNFSKPMIWPEFRFHSILFATRHVLNTILTLANAWPTNVTGNALARGTIILSTVKIASYITDKYGDRTQRTTNAMPYPPGVLPSEQLAIKRVYTSAQFGATVTSLMSDATMNFAPLLGIQMAPLLMTLVRKGKVSTGTYHRVYAICLTLGYVAIFGRLLQMVNDNNGLEEGLGNTVGGNIGSGSCGIVGDTLRALILYSLPFKKSRQYVSAVTFWTITIALATIVYPMLVASGTIEQYVSSESFRKLIWLGLVRTIGNQVITYSPLFRSITVKRIDNHASGGGQWSGLIVRASQGVICSCGLLLLVHCCCAKTVVI